MQYLIPAIISASGLIANAAPVAKGHDGIQPMTPPATYVGGKLVVQWNPDVSGEWKDMDISLVSKDKKEVKKLASGIDGTSRNNNTYISDVPSGVHSGEHYVQFSHGKDKKLSQEFEIEAKGAHAASHSKRSQATNASESRELYQKSVKAHQLSAAAKQTGAANKQKSDSKSQHSGIASQSADKQKQQSAIKSQKSDIASQSSAANKQKAGAKSQQSDTASQSAAFGKHKAQVKSQHGDKQKQQSAIKSQKSDIASQSSAANKQKAGIKSQHGDIASQSADKQKQKSAIKSQSSAAASQTGNKRSDGAAARVAEAAGGSAYGSSSATDSPSSSGLSLIHISEPRDAHETRMPSSA